MQQYLAEILLPVVKTDDYLQLIPVQRSFVERMFKRGFISSYALSKEHSKIWVSFAVPTSEEAEAIIRQFPIADYISYTLHELAFRNSFSNLVPAISLN